MTNFGSDINPPPNFDNDKNELPVGYVGATTMPGPIVALPADQEAPKLENVKERDPNKDDRTETGTCHETENEIPGQGNIREYEKPSYLHGTKDTIVGSLKEAIGKSTGYKETKTKGRVQKEGGKREVSNYQQENKYDNKYE